MLHFTLELSDPKRAAWFKALKRDAKPDIGHGLEPGDTPWLEPGDTPWHRYESQHLRFRHYMKRLLKKFGVCAGPEPEMRTMGESDEPQEGEAALKLAS